MEDQTHNVDPDHSNLFMKKRFDGFLPVVVDVETGGGNYSKDALLEIGAVLVEYNNAGLMMPTEHLSTHVIPFEGGKLNPDAMKVNRIKVDHPFRLAIPEQEALEKLFQFVRDALNKQQCRRAILVGHNAHFDLSFIQAAVKRCKIKDNPFHTYTVFDTATLGGLIYRKTVLAKALKAAKIEFDHAEAHAALYDAQKTAELFCQIINQHS